MLTEIRTLLPGARLLYVADRARAPFGPRSLEEVEQISLDIAAWLIGRGADCLVVACNTASAAALETLRRVHPRVPIVGMEPAVKPAAATSASGKVAVFATAATFQGRLFESVVSRFAVGVEVITRACPEWVELVETGRVEGEIVDDAVGSVVGPVVAEGADVAVLACTHFSYLKPVIERVGGVPVIDPAPAVAAQTARVAPTQDGGPELTLAVSGDLELFARQAAALAGIEGRVVRFGP